MLNLTLANFMPAFFLDVLILFGSLLMFFMGHSVEAVILLGVLRIAVAIDRANVDGIRSVLAHIYSRMLGLTSHTSTPEDSEDIRP